MEIIQKELFCRIGKDYQTGVLFIGGLGINNLDMKIADLVRQRLGLNPKELHDKTTNIKKFDAHSITGDDYLAEKVVKLKFAVVIAIEECKLVDDMTIEDATKKEREETEELLKNLNFEASLK
jgi:hypothetical protein